MALISVIIPAFNVEKHLSKCLESVLQQSFEDWEVILVDDGSTDGTGCIADTFAKKDSRIHVFHTGNGGVSSARNLGIQYAKGEWLTFVDSDDFISQEFFAVFCNRLNQHSFDLFMADVQQLCIDGSSFIEYHLPNCYVSVRESICVHKILRSGDLHGKCFKKEIIREYKLSFSERICYSEDRLFFDQFLFHCRMIALSADVLYTYLRNNAGLSFRLNSFESEFLCYRELKTVLFDIAKKNELSIFDLLHDNLMLRTIMSLVNEETFSTFRKWFVLLDELDQYFLRRCVTNFKYGKFFRGICEQQHICALYFCLKVYLGIKKWKQMFKK